jgi:RNA polymerase sigma factor (sigma-70 family)
MPVHRVRSFVRSALATATGAAESSDTELLARFLAARDESAFAALVRRHGPLVRAVCSAHLRNPADADDAVQATFLVLARRAEAIRDRAALGGWLSAVAGRVARRLRASARAHAALPDDLPDPTPGAPDTRLDLRAVLEEEVARLPEVYRLAVQVCYVTGRTTTEAATLLGWAKGTVLTRLAWARRRLRARLAARGVGLTVGALGVLLIDPVARAVDGEFLANTARAAVAVAAGEPVSGVVSERTESLSQGVVRTMALNKLKWATGAILVAVLAGVAIGKWSGASASGAPPARPSAPTAPPETTSRPADPPAPLDSPPPTPPTRTPVRPTVQPQPTQNLPVPDPTPSAQPIPSGAGRQFVVSRPIGTWSREVFVSLEDGTADQPVRITVKFEEDRLTVRTVAMIDRQAVETILEADYSITKDSVVFGVVTGYDVRLPAGGRLPTGLNLGEADYTDQPFTFRFRVDGGTLTMKDLRMPGVKQPGDAGFDQLLGGRFSSGADEGAAPNPPPPAKGRGPSVLPGRARPPALNPQPVVPPSDVPGPVPGRVQPTAPVISG